jgi:hypothetical protein
LHGLSTYARWRARLQAFYCSREFIGHGLEKENGREVQKEGQNDERGRNSATWTPTDAARSERKGGVGTVLLSVQKRKVSGASSPSMWLAHLLM